MSAIGQMILEVQEYTVEQMCAGVPESQILESARELFGSFGEYAEEVMNPTMEPDLDYNNPIDYNQLVQQINDEIPF
jgi:hypothetical protein